MPSQYINDINTLNAEHFNYGTTPKQPVAEQNQTYFAYFDGVGGTGPEYIDGTAYFIKYLIDTEGNVVNPEPFTVADSPQSVPLYNLLDNFEVGKSATVKLIESDPTVLSTPNAEILQGTHKIAHVGRIVPILVTETGVNNTDYITTMSFGSITPTNQITTNATFYVQKTTSLDDFSNSDYVNIAFENITLGDTNVWGIVPAVTYPFDVNFRIFSSSFETNTRIRFKIDLYVEAGWAASGTYRENQLRTRILQNGTEIFNTIMSVPNGTAYITNGFSGVMSTGFSPWIDYNADDTFNFQARVLNNDNPINIKGTDNGRTTSLFQVFQENPFGSDIQIQITEGVNAVYSDYIDGVSNNWNLDNGGYTTLTLNPSFYPIYNSGLTQNLSADSSAMNFSPINIPFNDIKPGDFIRFDYNKTKIHTIFRIRELDYGSTSSSLALYITPAISNLDSVDINTSTLNHFVVYRVINDGTYVVLDVKKDAPGGAYSGILQPQFVSKELVEKYDKIIQTLTEKEIIN